MPPIERNLDDVVKTLRNAKGRRGASLLIGAGCSVSAGVPLAKGFVTEIVRDYAHRLQHLPAKTYPHCMAELAPNERNDVIAPHIDKASINWAHVAIAQLMKHGYVSRILTTNFDPLVVKACAMVGVFPAIYDLAASPTFLPDRVYEPAVFYLHGQRAGFVTLHTQEEVEKHKKALAPVFENAGQGRVWMVCGYSGDQDPVFDHLAEVSSFGYNLYWVGYKDADPAEHVQKRLLGGNKYAFYVRGFDADSFFVEVARRLDCFPPDLISKPFSHLLAMTDLLAPFTVAGSTVDLKETARTRIKAAIDAYEQGGPATAEAQALRPDALDAMSLVFSGKYDEVLQLFEATKTPSEELREAAAWALVSQGTELYDRAEVTTGADAEDLFDAAVAKYEAALRIAPKKHEALNNWGLVLATRAKGKDGDEAAELRRAAIDKYTAALAIERDNDAALNNFGNVLADEAATKTGAESDALFARACEKYAAAVKVNADKHDALYNWGIALAAQAKSKAGHEADALWSEAGEKYAAALKIKPDKHEALNNWGVALAGQAKSKVGAEADALWTAAGEKYAAALEVKPDKHETLNNWGIALAGQARTKAEADADVLWRTAGEKYAAALRVKPDKHETLHNWGLALAAQARTKTGADADSLWCMAAEKYAAALEIKPDKYEVLKNWGVSLAAQAETKTGAEADVLWRAVDEKYAAALRIKPDDHETLNNWGIALAKQAETKSGPEADALWRATGEKYAAALQIKHDKHEALFNWGIALAAQANTKAGAEANALWQAAGEKYAAALQLKPDKHEVLANWSTALIEHSRVVPAASERESLLTAASEKCVALNELVPGAGSYNLACAHALRGDSESCRKWLLHSKEHGKLPAQDHLLNDRDLASVREEPWFRDLIAQ